VFASALGIGRDDWRHLHDQLLTGLRDAPVRRSRISEYGVHYEVVILVEGLNGKCLPVMTGWLLAAGGVPRLVTARVHTR
jgi:hypothetical protein